MAHLPGFAELVKHIPGTRTGVTRLGCDPPGLTVLKHLVQKAKPVRYAGFVDINGNLSGGHSGHNIRVAHYARYMTQDSRFMLSIARRKMILPSGAQQTSKIDAALIRCASGGTH